MMVLKRSKIVRSISFLILLIPAITSQAQDSTKLLQLSDAIKTALLQNRQVGLAVKDERIAQSNVKQTEAIWLPQLNLSYTGYTTNQPLNAFGFKLQQAKVQSSDFNPTTLNSPGSIANFVTQLSLQQPIYNPDLTLQRKAAAVQAEMYTYQTRRTEEATTLQVTTTYLQLEFAYKVVNVLEEALKTVKDIYRFTNDRFQLGLLQKSDLLNVEVEVKTAETNLAEARSQLASLSDQLSYLMNTKTGIVYKTASVEIPGEDAPDTIPANRSDVRAMEKAMQAYDLSIKSTKSTMLPKLNAFANYQFNDKSVFGFGAGGYFAGLQLSWDIFKGNVAKNKSRTQQLEKSKLQDQLNNTIAIDEVALKRSKRELSDLTYRISQQQLAVESAAESFRITQNRYNQGLVNTTDVLGSQTQLARQKMLYAQALFSRKSIITYINFLINAK